MSSTRIGNSRIVLADGTEFPRHRFEWWPDGRAVVTNDNQLVLREWTGTVLEQRATREWAIYAEGEWLATVFKRGG